MSEYLEEGFSATYTFANAPSITLKEIDVTPPGVDGGGGIEQTTQRNTIVETQLPRALKKITMGKFTAAYDPAVWDDIIAQVNVNQLITVTYPDDDTLAFWGWLNKFQPNGMKKGERPTADVEIEVSNLDDEGTETLPVHTSAA